MDSPLSGNQFEEQLSLFLPAKDLMDSSKFRHSDAKAYPSNRDMWETKTEEAGSGSTYNARETARYGKRTLTESVRDYGVQDPVHIATHSAKAEDKDANEMYFGEGGNPSMKMVVDGHHRIAAANAVSPDTEVPVLYAPAKNHQIHRRQQALLRARAKRRGW